MLVFSGAYCVLRVLTMLIPYVLAVLNEGFTMLCTTSCHGK